MGMLTVVFVSIAAASLVFSEQGEVPSGTHEEVKRVLEDDALEDEFHRVFTRGAVLNSWGGGDYKRTQQKAILEAHNDYRRRVSPQSSDMNELVWSSQLAEQAQVWSDGCVYEHPDKDQHTDYEGIGQNLFIKWLDEGGANPPDPAFPVQRWYEEVNDYHYQQNSCNPKKACGHYTQVVWAKTTEVGCGMTFCPVARKSTTTYINAWIVTCNYSPAGNMEGVSPYKSGKSCSACEKGFCREGLCSICKSGDENCACKLDCQNGGTLNESKCKCTCPNGFYGLACESPCKDTDSKCGIVPGGPAGWPVAWCEDEDEQHKSVKEKCPAMCGVCTKCESGEEGCECGLDCQNGGTLNESKCKCTCPKGFNGLACESRCVDTDSKCGIVPGGPAGWPVEYCEQYTIVKAKCPAMCGVCTPGSG